MQVTLPMNTLNVIAPAFTNSNLSESAIFGAAIWLWMNAEEQKDLPLKALTRLLLPPLKNKQYILVTTADQADIRPVAYAAWANVSADAERRYLDNPAFGLAPEDWASGDRMWVTDCFAPLGHIRELKRIVDGLLTNSCARYLHHRGNERGMQVRTWRGKQISKLDEQIWWHARPMLATSR